MNSNTDSPLSIIEELDDNNNSTFIIFEDNRTDTSFNNFDILHNFLNNNEEEFTLLDFTNIRRLIEDILAAEDIENDEDRRTNNEQIIAEFKQAWEDYQKKHWKEFGRYPENLANDNNEKKHKLSCFICLEESANEWYISQCGHLYCSSCVGKLKVSRKPHQGCCVCRQPWLFTKIFTPH